MEQRTSWSNWVHGRFGLIIKKPCRRNHDHECVGEIIYFLIQDRVGCVATDARAPLEGMRHEHAVVGEEFAPLDNVVAASAEEGGADDADDFG